MRFSCNPDSEFHWLTHPDRPDEKSIKVFLDGIERTHVMEVDDVEGFVTRAVLDEDGYAEVDPDNPYEILQITERGNVTIEFVE